MSEYQKPLPVLTADNEPYYRSAREHRLRIQRCRSCGRCWLPPAPYCCHCTSTEHDWVPVSGRGRVYSWTVVHEVYHPSFQADVPYNLAVVALEEGPRLLTNLVDLGGAAIAPDLPVEIVYDDVTPEVTLVKFRPSRPA